MVLNLSLNQSSENFIILIRTHSPMCIRIYIFKFKNQQITTQKQESKKKNQKRLIKKREYLRKID